MNQFITDAKGDDGTVKFLVTYTADSDGELTSVSASCGGVNVYEYLSPFWQSVIDVRCEHELIARREHEMKVRMADRAEVDHAFRMAFA